MHSSYGRGTLPTLIEQNKIKLKKQLKISDEIIREENEKSGRSIEEVREEKQIKEKDKQPQK